jgi:serine/threonine-protein kinase
MALAIETSLPLAAPSQVGQWVETMTADLLAERRRQIAEIERETEGVDGGTSIRLAQRKDPNLNVATSPGARLSFDEVSISATRPEGRAPQEAMFTDTSLVASEPQVPRRSGRRTGILGAASVLVLATAVAGTVLLFRRESVGPAAYITTASAPAASAPAGSAAAAPFVSTPPDPPPPVASSTPLVSPTDLPEAPRPPVAPRVFPVRRAQPSVSCNPPYTIDANGYKKYKRECATW